jgi:3-carboxy-cis,cis-muconate cycloisomerase
VDRGPVLRIADWQGRVMAALAHMAQSTLALTMTETAELALGAAGASSTMPQKQNPVGPSAIVALGHQFTGQRATLQAAAAHQHQRDGGAWFAEWMAVPQLALSLAAALNHTKSLVAGLTPHPVKMHSALTDGLGLIHAEALSFALAETMPRPAAQKVTKQLCQDALAKQVPLADLVHADYPDVAETLFDPSTQMGQAPADAAAFVARARAL